MASNGKKKSGSTTFFDARAREELHRRLGWAVRGLREKAGLSQYELAIAAGISVQYLSDCERGSRRASKAIVQAVAAKLKVPVDELVLSAGACTCCGGSGVRKEECHPEPDSQSVAQEAKS